MTYPSIFKDILLNRIPGSVKITVDPDPAHFNNLITITFKDGSEFSDVMNDMDIMDTHPDIDELIEKIKKWREK